MEQHFIETEGQKLDRIKRDEAIFQLTSQVDEQDTAVFDSGATSHCGREDDNFIPTDEPSHKVFHLPNGQTTNASKEAKLHHEVRDPARTVDIVPDLKHNSLLSGSKFADANYVSILTPKEVLIYDGKDLTITVSSEAILRGWRDDTGFWRVPLQNDVAPKKSQYLLMNKESEEAIANVYELPSSEKIVRYLHACAGFPTKPTWLKAIKGGNYATWPHLSAEAVRKHFPESDETHQGHMRSVKQGIRSTKQKKEPITIKVEGGEELTIPLKKHNDIYVRIEEQRETMYTDQTGAFPTRSRKGNRYIMIMCEMDSNVILSEAMKNRTAGEMVRAYQVLMKKLKAASIKPKKHVLDNKDSTEETLRKKQFKRGSHIPLE